MRALLDDGAAHRQIEETVATLKATAEQLWDVAHTIEATGETSMADWEVARAVLVQCLGSVLACKILRIGTPIPG